MQMLFDGIRGGPGRARASACCRASIRRLPDGREAPADAVEPARRLRRLDDPMFDGLGGRSRGCTSSTRYTPCPTIPPTSSATCDYGGDGQRRGRAAATCSRRSSTRRSRARAGSRCSPTSSTLVRGRRRDRTSIPSIDLRAGRVRAAATRATTTARPCTATIRSRSRAAFADAGRPVDPRRRSRRGPHRRRRRTAPSSPRSPPPVAAVAGADRWRRAHRRRRRGARRRRRRPRRDGTAAVRGSRARRSRSRHGAAASPSGSTTAAARCAVHGWTRGRGRRPARRAPRGSRSPASSAFVVTDIARDGTLDGPRRRRARAPLLGRRRPSPVIASRRRRRRSTTSWPCARGRSRARRRDHRQGALRGSLHRRSRPWPPLRPQVLADAASPGSSRASTSTAGRVVKGVNFVGLRDAGDPVELAARYDAEGADELVFLDITASSDGRDTMVDVVAPHRRGGVHPVHRRRRHPLGRRRPPDAPRRRRQGVASTPRRSSGPSWCREIADRVRRAVRGRARSTPAAASAVGGWEVFSHGGRTPTGHRRRRRGPREVVRRGAGEILLTSMDRDGTRDGFDLELTRAVVDAVQRPGHRAAAASARSSTWSRASSRAAPTRCSPRRSSTSVSTRSPRRRRCWRPRGHRAAGGRMKLSRALAFSRVVGAVAFGTVACGDDSRCVRSAEAEWRPRTRRGLA